MKTIFQIAILLCFSLSISAQKITCDELMKLPFGKYLYDNDGDSIALVVNSLEDCGVEKYELDMSLLSIFISNIVGEKGKGIKVQDLYDEILIFRKQNDSEVVKAHFEKEEMFKEKYFKTIVTKENWTDGKSLIVELYAFDEIEFEAFTNKLFEEEGDELNKTFDLLMRDYKKYIKATFHLHKAAKRDSTDFNFPSETSFPSMNYFARTTQFLYSNKPTLVYFYGYGTVNCAKLNDGVFYNVELYKLVKSEFNFITLAVDERMKLPQELKEKVQSKYPENRLRDVGSLNSLLELQMADSNRQPCFLVLNNVGQIIAKFDYETAKDAKAFIEALTETLK